ncbi:MAG: gliding motility-associated C-terminal domain-containing protein [Bacteroidales bacterium]|nr:gliding motility-associated C-terminal domain-containing protein [Bacteroidales bacterium]
MKSSRFLKPCLILSVCAYLGLNVLQAQQIPDRPILESVSVDPRTGYITIVWDVLAPPVSSVGTDAFVIYWYEKSSLTNHFIATMNPATRSYTFDYDTMAVRTPMMPDPRKTSVGFTVAAVHNSPYSSSLRSYEDYHVQVRNKYDSCRAEIRLDWHPYKGWIGNTPPYSPLISYHVMRIPEGGGPDEEIKALSDQDTFYIVPRVNENDKYAFYIKAVRGDGTTATSYRTTRETKMPVQPSYIYAAGTQYNSSGLAEVSFKLDPASETYGYEFFGSSKPDYSFVSLGTFNIHGDTVLTDIQKREKTYYYKLQAWHLCKDKYTAASNMATALWLYLKQDDQVNSLQWNPYLDWSGDARYELHRQIGAAFDEVIATITDPATTAYKDDLSGVKIDGDICYWVTAAPVSPNASDRQAISNSVCIQPESEIFIPQAFTPNGDGQNDEYKPFFSYPPQEYILCVYDHNGAKVYQTEDVNAGWDGRLKNGRPAGEGVYAYYLKFRTARGWSIEKKGTFNLILP